MAIKKSCSSCKFRWFGIAVENFVAWHCRRPNAKIKIIGSDADLDAAEGCKFFEKGC